MKHIIIEMSSVSYIDSSAGKLLVQIYKDYSAAGISLYLAAASGMESYATTLTGGKDELMVFITVTVNPTHVAISH